MPPFCSSPLYPPDAAAAHFFAFWILYFCCSCVSCHFPSFFEDRRTATKRRRRRLQKMMAARTRSASIFRAGHCRRSLPVSGGVSVGRPSDTIATTANDGWRGRAAALLLHHQQTSSHFVHTTPLILSDDSKASPFSRLSKLNSSSSGGGGYDGTRPKPNTNNHSTTAASTVVSQTATFDDDGNNDDIQYNYTTDAHNFGEEEESDRLKLWHESKEAEFQQLNSQTTKLLDSSSSGRIDSKLIMSQLQQWDKFISSITTDMDFDFRTKNPYYPPSEFMTSITYNAAENAQSLLMRLTKIPKIQPEVEVTAYKLVMSAWSNVYHWSSGDRCEEIIDLYGQKFGGDMNYMPSINDYKTVMKAHLKSCSSRYNATTASDADSATTTTISSPGEKALEILNLINTVYTAGDLFLKPDVELYSHTIAVVRNALLDWQKRRRFCESDASLEKQLCLELLNTLEQMEVTMGEEAAAEEKDAKIQSSLEKWRCIIRAYCDAIAVVSKVPLGDEGSTSIRSSEQILETLEQFVSSNVDAILQSAGEDEPNNTILEEIRRCIEGAYVNKLSSQLTVSDFNTALANASASEAIFNRMKERSAGVSTTEESVLFPAPTPDHVQALIRAYVECLRGRYFRPAANKAMEQSEELPHLKAQRLLKELEVQQAGIPIDGSLYSEIAWACTQIPHWPCIYKRDKYAAATNSAKALLKHTMNQYSQGSINFSWTGTATKMYNFIFGLNSQMATNSRNSTGKEASMKQALQLYDDMEYWYKESGGAIAKPDTQTLGLILKTIVNSGQPSSFECAQTMFQRLLSCGVKAKERDYLLLMKAANDPTKVEEILNRVKANYDKDKSEKPSVALYTEYISAVARSGEYNASKVMDLFDELNELYQSTSDPDFCPDSTFYGAIFNAISKSKSKGDASIRNAIQLLDKMERKFDDGLIDVGPNRYAYTSILSSISQARTSDGHVLAEDLLRRMNNRSRILNDDSLLPDVVAYTALLQAFASSRSSDKIVQAKKWFDEMETRYAEGNSDLKPNKITYTAMINCWRTSGRPDAGEQAQKVLELVEQRYKEGDYEIKPDAMMYSSVIDAWSRGRSNEKIERAWELYSHMREQYSKGNVDMKPNDIVVSNHCCLSITHWNR
jgi:hypothetical protein